MSDIGKCTPVQDSGLHILQQIGNNLHGVMQSSTFQHEFLSGCNLTDQYAMNFMACEILWHVPNDHPTEIIR